MPIGNVSVAQLDDSCEVRIRITPVAGRQDEKTVWFRFPAGLAGRLAECGDALVPLLLLPAMLKEEKLVAEAPVSPVILANSQKIQDIFLKWAKGSQRVTIETPAPDPGSPRPGEAVGCFFSGGVDSFYSLLKNQDSITHLILLRGFDFHLNKPRVHQETRAMAQRVATEMHKELLEVSTNIREFSDGLVAWDLYHGSVMATVGLLLSPLFREVIIPSTYPYDYLFPYGSHLILDPLWSNGQTTFVHDGSEASRVDKTLNICQSDLALASLRVCWKNPNQQYNCGRCEKCLRTMICLHIGGALVRCATLPKRIDPRKVRGMKFKSQGFIELAEEIKSLLDRETKTGRELAKALGHALRKSRRRLALEVLRGKRI